MHLRLVLAGLLLASSAAAQDPSREYVTIATPHFRVSFTRALEPLARRVAANAERAYAQLSAELHPPRGVIEVLVTDDFDFSNGSAITYPTNRITVFAMPPVNDFGLRYTTDWAQMVVTHELAHIFHLDRVRGPWRLLQSVFGRSPFLFPNSYQPSWLIEGLAVYEESRHAGQGRIEGPEHRLMIAAMARDRAFPRIGDASLALPTFPQGSSAYVLGSMFMDYLARTRGDSAVRRYVDAAAVQPIPYLVDIPARRAFGTSFSRAWTEWVSHLESNAGATGATSTWRDLTGDQLVASFPRWTSDTTLSFTATDGREMLSAFTVTTSGRLTRESRRNGASPTVRLPSGDEVYSQFEYVGLYQYRSDLFIESPDGRTRRLTTGQRLFHPDGRADGALVAMQAGEATTRLVRVGLDGSIAPITRAHPDTLWSEPRWSRRGDRLAAVRWLRGGVSQVVVLDSTGALLNVTASGPRVFTAPSWLPGDAGVLFIADGRVWRADVNGDGLRHVALGLSLLDTEARRDTIAGVSLRGTGFRLGVAPLVATADTAAFRDTIPDRRLPPLGIDSTPERKYSALRQLAPRYWVPLAESGFDGAYLLGGYIEGWDILRRHSWYADARFPTDNSGINWSFDHTYRGIGQPVLSSAISQSWTPIPVFDRSSPPRRVGTLRRRLSDGEVLASFVRQRVRSTASFSFGGGIERRDYFGDPPSILAAVDRDGIFGAANFPRLTASASYARYDMPAFAVSPEDGFSVAITARERLKSAFNATGGPSTSVVSALSLYKSLDLPGYAHHVIAIRTAAGWADTRAPGYFDVGGVSGGTYQVFPGYTIGEGRRTFPVRGFDAGTGLGIRAGAASLEYRAPLSIRQRSISTLPTFLQRSSVTLFADYGIAWCPSTLATRQVCVDPSQEVKTDFASAGGEVTINAGLLSWDTPTRIRLGFAVPVHNGEPLGARAWTPYIATGIAF